VNERFLRFESGSTELVGVLSVPDGDLRGAVLIVHPFAEEKKFAHRVLVNAAWTLARSGFATLRFDLSGCGDSFGTFREATLKQWLADVSCATDVLRHETGCARLSLLGLRLGATLCRLANPALNDVRALILWEPVLSGRRYVEALWRKKLIKDMMTSGRGRITFDQARAEIARIGFIDLDGWDLGAPMLDELVALDLTQAPTPCTVPTLAVQIAFNAKVSAELTDFAASEHLAGAAIDVIGIRERPIWDRIDIVPATELITRSLDWLREH
jgi:uncharacterized protein